MSANAGHVGRNFLITAYSAKVANAIDKGTQSVCRMARERWTSSVMKLDDALSVMNGASPRIGLSWLTMMRTAAPAM